MKSFIYNNFAHRGASLFLCELVFVVCGSGVCARATGFAGAPNGSSFLQAATGARQANSSAGAEQTTNAVPVSETEPMPAKVILKNGTLTVEANNSDLSQILREIAAASGMTIDGAIRSVRVYGVYGPSNSRSVLTALLQGLGYNFIMVGATHDGAPQELTLTPQTGVVTPPSAMRSAAASNQENSQRPDEDAIRRGALLHVPPPPPDDPQVRMEQHLQHLQQMRNPLASQNQPQ